MLPKRCGCCILGAPSLAGPNEEWRLEGGGPRRNDFALRVSLGGAPCADKDGSCEQQSSTVSTRRATAPSLVASHKCLELSRQEECPPRPMVEREDGQNTLATSACARRSPLLLFETSRITKRQHSANSLRLGSEQHALAPRCTYRCFVVWRRRKTGWRANAKRAFCTYYCIWLSLFSEARDTPPRDGRAMTQSLTDRFSRQDENIAALLPGFGLFVAAFAFFFSSLLSGSDIFSSSPFLLLH